MENLQISPEQCRVEITHHDPPWRDYLQHNPHATLFHDPRWAAVMHRAYRNTPVYLTARTGDRITGVLQAVIQKSLLFGRHMCSLPYFDAAGILADDSDTARLLITEARGLLESEKLQWAECRHTSPIDETLPRKTEKITLRLTLPASEETLWKQFNPKVRNQIRKARKAGLTEIHGGENLLDDFYAVYLRNMRDLGSPPHSKRFFRLILEQFPDAAAVTVIRHAGRPLAAGFTLADRHALRVPWAAADWRERKRNANMFLYWAMLSRGCRMTAPCFDFGRSSRASGTHKFKKQWDAEEIPLYWEFLMPAGGDLPDFSSDNAKYRTFIACWKKMPLWAVRRLGPLLIGKLC